MDKSHFPFVWLLACLLQLRQARRRISSGVSCFAIIILLMNCIVLYIDLFFWGHLIRRFILNFYVPFESIFHSLEFTVKSLAIINSIISEMKVEVVVLKSKL